MPPDPSVESRLTDIEEELRRIKQVLAAQVSTNDVPWWKQIIGSHENDPVFKEIVELGRKIREGSKRTPKTSGRKRRARSS